MALYSLLECLLAKTASTLRSKALALVMSQAWFLLMLEPIGISSPRRSWTLGRSLKSPSMSAPEKPALGVIIAACDIL
ncbi:hypothetical protein EDD21DRAFT_360164 [Dissophora ornata]|nr:hypothetical protein EDD21DRAFT_360164 [Dissophora ornata]